MVPEHLYKRPVFECDDCKQRNFYSFAINIQIWATARKIVFIGSILIYLLYKSLVLPVSIQFASMQGIEYR